MRRRTGGTRRDFLKLAGVAAASAAAPRARAAAMERICVLLDGADAVAGSGPVRRAAQQLSQALAVKGAHAEIVASPEDAAGANFVVVAARPQSKMARGFSPGSTGWRGQEPEGAESLRMTQGQVGQTSALLVEATDALGFVYALLELAERVEHGEGARSGLTLAHPMEERPANETRSVGRYFCCELEDKPWYYDKDFWGGYLDTLVASRFNRFCFAFGLEYDFPRGVTDDYFHFPYPYLVEVPGYADVRVVQLRNAEGQVLATPVAVSGEERRRNLETLQFIAAETAARGLHFQLGIWTHAYAWTDSPNAYHRIEGLTPETHAAYCRDALAILLRECPEIQGLTMRVHGESGIPEGDYGFWRTLFEAVRGCGRTVEIDMHAKGVDPTMIGIATATGMPVKLGAKFSAEHQSLGYQQADIRALEIPHGNAPASGPFRLSGGSRLFTRYGYADYLAEGAPYRLWFRLWPGTQRHLLSCDPETAAAYGRAAHFCGAAGLDICEPLMFKGREGSGAPGGRCAYADGTLNPDQDWKKFEMFYRVWGRKLYAPDADAETWRRVMRRDFGRGAEPVEHSLAEASRMLALVTSAHLSSASNHAFWPELNTNMPVVLGSEKSPYGDTPEPKCFGTVSPLDPQLFSTVVEHADDLLAERPDPKVSPVLVAVWLEDMAAASAAALREARMTADRPGAAEFRRIEEDVLIQIGLGTFFAKKLRSAVLWEIWQKTGDAGAGKLARSQYQEGRAAWATMAERAKGVYRADIGYGDVPMRRGCWMDRLPAIDVDLAAMQAAVEAKGGGSAGQAEKAVHAAMGRPTLPVLDMLHTPAESFTPGQPLEVKLSAPADLAPASTTVRLHYRHANQAERWQSVEMERGPGYHGAIPAEYTQSAFPLEYYFEVQRGNEAWMVPGFNGTLSNQPYYAVWRRESGGRGRR
ncbi:MAG TPA: hypothetical protein VHZ09_00975 [Acidobacteriaceae bacterium]|nr:hypothetical protein [Acidobacteriaceae bacterium]